MRSRIGVVGVCVSCLVLASCASLSGYPDRPETATTLSARQAQFFGPNASKNYDNTADPERRRAIRNDLVYGKMLVILDRFETLRRTLNGTGAGIAVGGDLTVLALNGIAATTGGTAAKSALSAASAGIVGAQGAINKDLYYQRTLPALLAQMDANFEKQRGTIIRNLNRSDADYPLKAAEIDLQRLLAAGSVPAAIAQITQQAEDDKAAADAKLETLRVLGPADDKPAIKLQAWLFTDGKVNQANYDALQAWLNRQPETYLHDYPAAAFAMGETDKQDLAPIRQRAIDDPALKIPH